MIDRHNYCSMSKTMYIYVIIFRKISFVSVHDLLRTHHYHSLQVSMMTMW